MGDFNPYALLQGLGIPVGYYVNERPGEVPFLIYFEDSSDNFLADNRVYVKKDNWIIELYTMKKDKGLQNRLEALFDDNEIIWRKGPEVYIQDDGTFMTPYYI